MKALAQKTGFSVADMPNDARLVRIVKDLAPSQSALRPRHVHSGRGLPMAA
jgi:fructose-specific component phosphotransferase system IIB-like protein